MTQLKVKIVSSKYDLVWRYTISVVNKADFQTKVLKKHTKAQAHTDTQ